MKAWWMGWLLLLPLGAELPGPPIPAPDIHSPLHRLHGSSDRDRKQARQFLDRARTAFSTGDLVIADDWARKAQDLDGDLLEAYLLRGRVLEGRGRLYEAENEYSVALLKNPGSRSAFEALLQVYLAARKWKQATRAVEAYGPHFGPYGTALYEGLVAYRLGDMERAANLFDRADGIAFWGGTPLPYADAVVFRARVEAAVGRHDRGRSLLARVMGKGTNRVEPIYYLGRSPSLADLTRLDRRWEIEAIGGRVLTRIQGRFDAKSLAFMLAEIDRWNLDNKNDPSLASRGKTMDALVRGNLALRQRSGMEKALEDLWSIAGEGPEPHLTASMLAEALGDVPRAFEALWRGLRLMPSDTSLLEAEVTLSLRTGEDLTAHLSADRLRKLGQLLDRPLSPGLRNLMAATDFRLGRYMEAATWLEDGELQKQPDLVRLRDLQFAFQGLTHAEWGDRIGYLTAVEESDIALVSVGKSRLFREALDPERAAGALLKVWSQAWENTWPPSWFLREALLVSESAPAAPGPMVQVLRETLEKRAKGPKGALAAAMVLSGEVSDLGSLGVGAGVGSLESSVRFALLTGNGEAIGLPKRAMERLVAIDGNPRALSRLWWGRWTELWGALTKGDLAAYDKAMAVFEKEVKGRVSNRMDLVTLAAGADALRETQAIRESLKRDPGQSPDWPAFLRKHGRFPFAQTLAIRFLLERDRLGEVDASLTTALQAFPDHAELHQLEGELHRRRGNREAALEAFRLARLLGPDLPEVYRLETLTLSTLGRHDEGERLLRVAGNRFGPTTALMLSGARLAYDRGNYADALQRFRALTLSRPGEVEGWNGAGVAAMALGRLKDAIFFFEHALSLGPDGQSARYHLAWAHGRLGNLERARDLFTQHLALMGDDPWTQVSLGQTLEALLRTSPPADFANIRRQARAAYGATMAGSPYYSEPHRLARSRMAILMEPTMERRHVDLGSTVRGQARITGRRGDLLVAALDNGKVVAWDLVSFKELWSFKLEEPAAMDPTPAGNLVALVGGSGRIHFIDWTGKARASYRTRTPLVAPPVWVEPFFLFPTEGGTIEVFAEGRILDPIHLPSSIATSPVLDGANLWVSLDTGLLLCVDLFTGKTIHRVALGAKAAGPLYLQDRSIYAGLEDGKYCAIDTRTGKIDYYYRHDSAPGVFQSPLQYQTVYGTADGQARLVDAMGRFYWDFRADGAFTAAPSINPELAVFPLATGAMTAVGVSDGKIRFTVRLGCEPACAPVFVDNDLLAVLGRDGRLRQFYYADESKPQTTPPGSPP